MEPKPAQEVISQAIRENRLSEILLYVFASVVLLVGVVTLVSGIIFGPPLIALTGAVESSLFVPAMAFAKRIRKENLAIRMLEIPLSRADTAQEAAQAIRDAFLTLSTEEQSLFSKTRVRK